MSGVVTVSRADVLAYRVAVQGLHRDGASVGDLGVLDIGVQEAMGHPAALAFAARLPSAVSPVSVAVRPGQPLALAWTLRGAPHVHRRADLDELAGALWPLSEADAAGRLNETGPSVARKGIAALDQFALAVAAMREVVTSPTPKGVASTEVTRRIPPAMRRDCRPCGVAHISDSAMRAAMLPAGLEIEPGTAPPVLVRREGARLPDRPDEVALTALAHKYLTYLGPATVGEVAGYLEARRADVASYWPDDVAQVSVDGRRAWLPASQVQALRSAPPAELVRLLGPFDPYLQARDRELVVPDKAMHKALWPVLGRPGVLLVLGEVAGIWRTKAGRTLTITVEAFAPLPPSVWRSVEDEAQVVATVRGVSAVTLRRIE